MVTHYTLQTKDHKLTIRELDLERSEFLLLRNALINYQRSSEKIYTEYVKDGSMPDMIKMVKGVLEDIDKLRKKLDGID